MLKPDIEMLDAVQKSLNATSASNENSRELETSLKSMRMTLDSLLNRVNTLQHEANLYSRNAFYEVIVLDKAAKEYYVWPVVYYYGREDEMHTALEAYLSVQYPDNWQVDIVQDGVKAYGFVNFPDGDTRRPVRIELRIP